MVFLLLMLLELGLVGQPHIELALLLVQFESHLVAWGCKSFGSSLLLKLLSLRALGRLFLAETFSNDALGNLHSQREHLKPGF